MKFQRKLETPCSLSAVSRNRFSTDLTFAVIEVPIVPTFQYIRTGSCIEAIHAKNTGESVIEPPISVIESPIAVGTSVSAPQAV
jgi:hypothetical protein